MSERAAPAFSSSGDLLADRRYGYAMAARSEGDLAEAAELLGQALEIAPGWPAGWFALGEVEAARGRHAAAVAAFKAALAHDPADALGAGLRLARLGATDAAGAMTPAYVAALFDQYAPRFDAALRRELGYRGPEILFDAVRRACQGLGHPFFFDRMLDLGCGTGLAGEVFARRVDVIDGVDLSPRMVAFARHKGLYHGLEVGDLSAFLASQGDRSADLAVAADVFVYCAELRPIFAACARVLDHGGLLAFTVETHDSGGVVLGPGLRYAHAEAAVRAALAASGFSVPVLEPASTRREAGRPVPGLAVVAVKP